MSWLAFRVSNPEQITESRVLTAAEVVRPNTELDQGQVSVRWFESSPGRQRMFCGRCGTNLTFEFEKGRNDGWPANVDVTVGSLDDEAVERLNAPVGEAHVKDGISWVKEAIASPVKAKETT
jgi:hypothetical protein